MTNDTAVQALLDYLNESDEPEIYWPRHHFEESCFSRWAAWEMIEAIMDHPMKDPEDVIEEFAITVGTNYGYKLHLVYGAQASPSEKNNQTVNDSPEAATMSWEISTTPVDVPNFKPTAHLVIDSTKTDKAKLAKLEEMLYGTDGDQATEPTLPMPEKVIELTKAAG